MSEWLAERLADAVRAQLANPGTRDGPEIPLAGLRVWRIFLHLNRTRGSNGWGPNPISCTDMEAYARVRREPIRPFEVDILEAMDTAYLEATARAGRQNDAAKQIPISSRPASIELFDALFCGVRG